MKKKLLKLIKSTYGVIIILFIFWMIFFDSNSLIIHNELNNDINQLDVQKSYYEEEIAKDEFEIKDPEINKMIEDLQLTLQSLNYKNKEIKTILPIIINEVDFLAKKENNLSFENLLKLAMNYLDKESSNIAS